MLHNQTAGALPVSEAALFLDLDGAILPVEGEPKLVRASPSCRIVLHRARDHLRGRFAVLSGRTIKAIDDALGGAVPCVAGVHGLQRRTPVDGLMLEPPHARVANAASVLKALARARLGLAVEAKKARVEIHYAAAPEAEAAVIDTVERLAHATGLEIERGRMFIALRTPGPTLGAALDRFMRETPFIGARPIFIGHGLSGEAGFAAARSHGGFGLLVGEAGGALAQGRFAGPVAALAWVMRSLDKGQFDFRETADLA